jgi:hypothetical protein
METFGAPVQSFLVVDAGVEVADSAVKAAAGLPFGKPQGGPHSKVVRSRSPVQVTAAISIGRLLGFARRGPSGGAVCFDVVGVPRKVALIQVLNMRGRLELVILIRVDDQQRFAP